MEETAAHGSVSPSRISASQALVLLVHCNSHSVIYIVSVKDWVGLVKTLRPGKTSGNLAQCSEGWHQGSLEGWGDSSAGKALTLPAGQEPTFKSLDMVL